MTNQEILTKQFDSNGELLNGVVIDQDGKRTRYFKDGLLHREDGPAIIMEDKEVSIYMHFLDGLLHREDGPAAYHANKHQNDPSVDVYAYKGGYVFPKQFIYKMIKQQEQYRLEITQQGEKNAKDKTDKTDKTDKNDKTDAKDKKNAKE
jgi:hypothetical protein